MMCDDMSMKHIWKLIFWTAIFLGGFSVQTHPFPSLSTVGGLHIARLFLKSTSNDTLCMFFVVATTALKLKNNHLQSKSAGKQLVTVMA